MRFFVTGATGFIGSHIVRRLVSEGHEVHILVREGSSLWRLADCAKALRTHNGDMTNAVALAEAVRLARPEVVLHLATSGVYGGVAALPEHNYRVNTVGLLYLLEALEYAPHAALINFGSSSEYGRKEAPMQEGDLCVPMSHYAISKLAATNLATLWAVEKKRSAVTARIFSPYGPWDEKTRLIPQAIMALSCGAHFKMPPVHAVRDYIYIDDLVEAVYKLIFADVAWRGEIINIGSGVESKACFVAEKIATLLDASSGLYSEESSDIAITESPVWVADIQKAKATLQWAPTYTLEDGLKATIEWFDTHAHLYEHKE